MTGELMGGPYVNRAARVVRLAICLNQWEIWYCTPDHIFTYCLRKWLYPVVINRIYFKNNLNRANAKHTVIGSYDIAIQNALEALGYSILASSTLRDCCERLKRYFRLATEQGELRTRQDEHLYYISSHRLSERISPEAIDTWHAFIVRIFRTLHNPDFAPVSVQFERPRPEGYEEIYHKAFHAPVTFDADYSEICLPLESVDEPLVGGNREIAFLVGFANTGSFSRAFRKWTGLPPSKYRQKLH